MTYVELADPVEGELRRERASDAKAPCPRCGAHGRMLIERAAEPQQQFTRWRALACAGCGAAGGWESAGRARRDCGAELHAGEFSGDVVAALSGKPIAPEVARLAPYEVLAPAGVRAACQYAFEEGQLNAVSIRTGAIEVTTSIDHRLPCEQHAGDALEQRVFADAVERDLAASDDLDVLQLGAELARAQAEIRSIPIRQVIVDLDGVGVAFALAEASGRWAAAADIHDRRVTITGDGNSPDAMRLKRSAEPPLPSS